MADDAVGKIAIQIVAEGGDQAKKDIDDVGKKVDGAQNQKVTIDIEARGADEAMSVLKAAVAEKLRLESDVNNAISRMSARGQSAKRQHYFDQKSPITAALKTQRDKLGESEVSEEARRRERIADLGRQLHARRSTPGAAVYRPEEDVASANRQHQTRQFYENQSAKASAAAESVKNKDATETLRLRIADDRQAKRELENEHKRAVASKKAADQATKADQRDTARLRMMDDKQAAKDLASEDNERKKRDDKETGRLDALKRQRDREGNRDFNAQQRASESLRNQREAAYSQQASEEHKNSPQGMNELREQQRQSHYQRFRAAGASDKDATIGANQIMAERAKAAAKELELLGRNAASTSPAWKAIREGFDMVGEGGVRRGFSHAITGAIGGDDPGIAAKLIGGFGGTLASSLFMPIAWGIGNMISELPGILMKAQEGHARFEAGGSSPLSPELESKANAKMNYWAAQGAGRDKFRQGAEYLQDAGFSNDDVIKYQDALMYLGEGAAGKPGALSAQFANVHRNKTSQDKWSLIKGSVPLEKYMIANYVSNQIPEQEREANLEKQVGRGDFNHLAIEEIVLRAVDANKELKSRTDSTANTILGGVRGAGDAIINGSGARNGSLSPFASPGFKDDPWNEIGRDGSGGPWIEKNEKGGWQTYSQEEMQRRHPRAPAPPTTNTMTRNQGDSLFDPNAPQKGAPERMGYDYSFHSATGLAEDMQRMWSGPGQDWQETTASSTSALQKMFENGTAMVTIGPATPHNQPGASTK